MSAEDVAVIEKFRNALAANDEDHAVSLLAPDVIFTHPRGTLRGIDEVRDGYLRAGSGAGPENLDVSLDPGELEDLGDGRVGATNHQVFRWKESGEFAYERRARIEYTIRDGRIARYEAKILDA